MKKYETSTEWKIRSVLVFLICFRYIEPVQLRLLYLFYI